MNAFAGGGTTSAWLGALLGLGFGAGVWLVAVGLPTRRAPTLDQRLAPYVGWRQPIDGRGVGARLLRVVRPAARRAEEWYARLGSDPESVRRRLRQAGDPTTLEQFRAQQTLSGLGAGAVGALLVGVRASGFGFGPDVGPLRAVLLVAVCVLVGVVARDQVLSWRARARVNRILGEFPAVAELLALSVAAGEGLAGALERVARTSSGELADELRQALGDTRTGAPLPDALEAMADRVQTTGLGTFVDGLVVALERGTPLADVLRAQAQDARVLARRRLMEAGGRREIVMMVPVVFLILPVTVLFAVYPGLAVLDLGT
ncbi:type II secretion system F family protein [Spongisporangium articulatum]|uniref:Type II secretion system F family protein n=1 Tax=Spongisporangium articulatum TaxID=3362603 RepID=A0ABW8AK04_9ACTN